MKHYSCTGECGGVAEKPGNCQAKDCSKQGHPLKACGCHDPKHVGGGDCCGSGNCCGSCDDSKENNTCGGLNVINFGLAIGIVTGIYIFFAGLISWKFAWGMPMVQMMGSWYRGFGPTMGGSLIGAIWGFADGFILGAVIAWIYNKLNSKGQ